MKPAADRPCHDVFAVRTQLSGRAVAATVLVAMAVVVASSSVAWNGTVPRWEAEPLRWIVSWPDWLEPGFWVVQQAGVLMAPLVAGLVVVWCTRRWQHLVAFALVLPLKLGVEKAIVKQLVDRERPFVSVGPDLEVRGPQLEGLAFPSGHATTAFATAVLLAALLPPKWRPLPLAWAMAVAVARMYLGEHNVLDVVAGAALGVMFAVLLWWALLDRDAPAGRQYDSSPSRRVGQRA